MEEGTEASSMPNFTPVGATCRPCGAKNLKIGLLKYRRVALRAMLPVTIDRSRRRRNHRMKT